MNFDYLRLFLALTVMLGHFNISILTYSFWDAGKAVYTFFCISGYLITQSYLRATSLKDYAIKRVSRIYPPIVCVVVLLFALGWHFHEKPLFFYSVASLLMFQDWLILHAQGVYTHSAFWTMVVEVQFYFLLPFIVDSIRKYKKPAFAVLALLYISSYYMRTAIPADFIIAFRGNVFFYADFFIAGIVMSLYGSAFTRNNWLLALSILPSVTIYYFWAFGYQQLMAVFLPFALMIIILAICKCSRLLGKRAFWGDISYGIYLYHFPVATVLTYEGYMSPKNAVLFTVLMAFISWHFWERIWLIIAHKHLSKKVPATNLNTDAVSASENASNRCFF